MHSANLAPSPIHKFCSLLKPTTHHRPIPTVLIYISVVSILVAVFIKIWTPTSLSRWPEALYTLAFFYGLAKERKTLLKHPMVLGLIAALVATPILFGINYFQDAERAIEYAHFEKLIRVYLFVPIAYWLSFNLRYAYLFVFVGFAGFITACLQDPNFAQTFKAAIAGRRVDFDLQNAQHLANWSGLYLLAWLAMIPSLKGRPLILKALILIPLGISLFGLYAAQTRALVIALLACAFVLVLVFYIKRFKHLTTKLKLLSVALTISATVCASSAFLLTDNTLKARFKSELPIITASLTGDLENVPNSSVGIRVHSWATALGWIAQKPIIGWGGDARGAVIESVEVFTASLKARFGHLHNAYLEFLVGYGFIGFLIAFFPIVWGVKSAFSGATSPIASFTLYGAVLFLAVNTFESYLFFWSGAFTLGLLLAPITAISIAKLTNNPHTSNEMNSEINQ